jgi:drug/metabolite transporter (DMT)-like permease
MAQAASFSSSTPPPRWQIYLAFAAVYIIWGSTYLGMKFAIETIPPLLMSATRFVIAGAFLLAYCFGVKRMALPTRRQVKAPVITGFLLIMVGNGGMAWAEQTVPSSVAALLVATTPLWFAAFGWLFYGENRPNQKMISGLLLGLVGMVVLIGPGQLSGQALDLVGTGVIMVGTLCWAFGSLYAAHVKDVAAPLVSTGLQMLVGGLCLAVLAGMRGDFDGFHVEAVSGKSFLALAYLIVFGSWIGYTSYSWLIRVVPPSQASTYAYVNPLVAVLLGWLLGGESITYQMLVAGAFILPGVILILRSKARKAPADPEVEEDSATRHPQPSAVHEK